jgi:hypothetical protein
MVFLLLGISVVVLQTQTRLFADRTVDIEYFQFSLVELDSLEILGHVPRRCFVVLLDLQT